MTKTFSGKWALLLLMLFAWSGCPKDPSPGTSPTKAPVSQQATAAPAAQEPWTTVFDFHANQLLAHEERQGGLWIPAGSASFAKYVHFDRPKSGWTWSRKWEDKPVAFAGKRARLVVPLLAEQAAQPRMQLFLKGVAGGTLQVQVKGKTASSSVVLSGDWQSLELPLAAGVLVAGENEIGLLFSKSQAWGAEAPAAAAAVAWIQVGGRALPADTAALFDRKTMQWPAGSARYHYMALPAGAHIAAEGTAEDCPVQVSVASDGKAPVLQPLSLSGAPAKLQGQAEGVQAYRVGIHAAANCRALAIRSLKLVRVGTLAARPNVPPPRNVVFWLSDDTRADRFGLWNPTSQVKTPVLDEWSKRATRFAVAYAQGNESRVSHASLFTGMYPARHQFIADKAVLSSAFEILPEVMKRAGRTATAHVANGYVTARWGFGDGWKLLHNHIHEGGGTKAEHLVEETAKFLRAPQTGPFFLYLGAVDAHVSWRAHQPWLSMYHPQPYGNDSLKKGLFDPELTKIVTGRVSLTEADKTWIKALYDSDISYTDQQFGRLLALLKETGHEQDTMVIFASDHGEEFWDHGRIGHSQSVHQELVHVPLWISYAPLFPEGKVVQEGVELVDIVPTVADALGVAAPAQAQGESLIPIAQGMLGGYPRPAVACQYTLAHTMRLGQYKLNIRGNGNKELFDAARDLGEKTDLSTTQPIALRFVSDPMGFWLAYQGRWSKPTWGVASDHLPGLVQELGF